jgi:hypothetical protein
MVTVIVNSGAYDPCAYNTHVMQTENTNSIPPDFLKAITSAYSDLMKQQRTGSNAFVRWPKSTKRKHEFVWLCEGTESLFTDGKRKDWFPRIQLSNMFGKWNRRYD